MANLTNWQKYKLLLWKNLLLEWNRKQALAAELLLPSVLFVLLCVLRTLFVPERKGVSKHAALNIDNIDMFKQMVVKSNNPMEHKLVYSPENPHIEKIIKLTTESLKLTGYRSYHNASALEKALIKGKYFAGIQFDDSWSELKYYPKHFSFALRFPSELRTSIDSNTWYTMKLFSNFSLNGPRNDDQDDGGLPVGYLREGFLPLQHVLTMSYMKLVAGKIHLPYVDMQRYPYVEYISDPLLQIMTAMLSLFIILGFFYSAISIVKYVTAEKEKQLKEVMKIMGLNNWIHWTAWFMKSFIMMGTSAVLIIILLKIGWEDHTPLLIYGHWSVLLLFLMVYITTSICFCFMLASFFSKATTASVVAGMLWIFSYMPYMMKAASYDQLDMATKLGWCLLPNSAMGFAFKVVLGFEGTGEGIQWSNLFTPVNVEDDLTMGYIIVMMLATCVIYMCICLYVEQIFPGEFGVPRKWNFIFTSNFWCGEKNYVDVEDLSSDYIERTNPDAFESEPKGQRVGLQVKNLKKKFGDKMAVKGLSINMYENEITVLLGHNGAGKTTTISMLTGMFPPTSGTAIINGCDIRTNIDGARMSLGICPQHNVLFDNLTVAQHLKFFSRLRGLKGDAIQKEVEKYITLINLEDKTNVASEKLSGGMKRKLSVCCALTGNTNVILLDEPSSGMDPAARRELWNLLQGEKRGRTILLTTHFMDEADVLGDRIAIMCDGELKCHGTSFFLKKKYGSGYRLICVKREGCKSDKVTSLLRTYIPDLSLKSEIGAELSYELPDNYSRQFEKMLGSLEKSSDDLKLSGYGISITSMEEVFMKVGAENDQNDSRKQSTDIMSDSFGNTDEIESITSDRLFSKNTRLVKGVNLLANQWHAMLLKKCLYTYRNKLLLFLQIILPIAFVTFTLLPNRIEGTYKPLPSITIGLAQYPLAVTVLETATNVIPGSLQQQISNKYQAIATSHGNNYEFHTTGNQNFSSYILDLGRTFQARINARYLASATITNEKITAWLNNRPLHTAPLTVNLVHNAMIKALLNDSYEITVTNAPLPYSTETELTRLKNNNIGYELLTELCFSFCFVSAFFIFFLIKERETRSKLLQYVGGVNIWTYWLSQLLYDLVSFILTMVIIILFIACWQEKWFSSFAELSRYLLILILFCCSVLPLTYFASFSHTDPATGFVKLLLFNIFYGLTPFTAMSFLPTEYKDSFKNFFMIVPHFSLAMGLNNLYVNAATRDLCGVDVLPNVNSCEFSPQCCNIVPYFDWAEPGVLSEVVCLAVVGVLFFLFIIIWEYDIFKILINLCNKCRLINLKPPKLSRYLDEDVAQERQRIIDMSSDDLEATNLVLDRVTKYYGNFLAVNQLSLCVKPVECFGLLGVNGAGKTTTFKMMTGDEPITFGTAYVKGIKFTHNRDKVHKETGYCPQFDGLMDDFTGRETLKIFCLIRGIHKTNIEAMSEELARSFGFMKHLDKETKVYSGGNKRKLSTAIAVIGNPSVIYLDEPTTGMDPAARRQLWNMVCRIRDSGKSIVLTSHSMEECEALCTRLAIMVNGELKCIGSTQHLKNKFSKGLVLKIKVNRNTDSMQLPKTWSLTNPNATRASANDTNSNINNVKDFVKKEFPQAILEEEREGMLTFHIPLSTINWSTMFGLVERNRDALNIEDYSISQTTLEEVFLQLAQQQREYEGPTKSQCCGGFCCCIS